MTMFISGKNLFAVIFEGLPFPWLFWALYLMCNCYSEPYHLSYFWELPGHVIFAHILIRIKNTLSAKWIKILRLITCQ